MIREQWGTAIHPERFRGNTFDQYLLLLIGHNSNTSHVTIAINLSHATLLNRV
jgi:hypothetical protein